MVVVVGMSTASASAWTMILVVRLRHRTASASSLASAEALALASSSKSRLASALTMFLVHIDFVVTRCDDLQEHHAPSVLFASVMVGGKSVTFVLQAENEFGPDAGQLYL